MQLAENCPLGKSKVYGGKGLKLNEKINTHTNTVSRDGFHFLFLRGHATGSHYPIAAILDLSFNQSVFLTFFEGLLSFNAKNIMAKLRIKLTE